MRVTLRLNWGGGIMKREGGPVWVGETGRSGRKEGYQKIETQSLQVSG